MARPRSTTLTEGEQRVMEVLWELGEASVQEVTDALARREHEPIAYTTALTVLRILNEKNYVDYRKEGKAHVYVATVTREAARSTAVHQLLRRFFAGSPQKLAQHLLQAQDIDSRELDRLSAQVQKARSEGSGAAKSESKGIAGGERKPGTKTRNKRAPR